MVAHKTVDDTYLVLMMDMVSYNLVDNEYM